MAPSRILVLVLAGGAGERLELLTATRAKPAVPFAGVYRLIDFPLSNCQHAGIADVWVSIQHHPASLTGHLANGRPWDLDRTAGGMLTLPPHRGSERAGWHSGTADSLWRNAELVRAHRPDALVLVSSDAVYTLDYREVVDAHREGGQQVTTVTTEVAAEDAGRYGVVQVGEGGVVTDYAYKPDDPKGTTVTNEVFVFTPDPALDRLEALAREAGDDGLSDLGDELLPDLVADGLARAYPLDGYWRDVGTVQAYWDAHRDFLGDEPPLRLDDPRWPVHTREGADTAARVLRGAEVDESLLSGGTCVAGTVRGSVLSPGVVVEAGATVVDSVLLPDVRVRAGATVRRAVLDDGVVVGAGASVGGADDAAVLRSPAARQPRRSGAGEQDSCGIALVGRAAELAAGAVVGPGGRWPEPDPG